MEDSRIVYLSVPESLRGQFEHAASHTHDEHGNCIENHSESPTVSHFEIDPAIPLPAEIPPGEDRLPLERLSWEMIISGMIRVVTAEPAGEDADYYRMFIAAVKPGLLTEFFDAALVKAEAGDFEIAEDIATSLRAVYPHSPLAHLTGALVAEHKGDAAESAGREQDADLIYSEAAAHYKQAVAEKPPLPAAFFNAGYFYLKRQNFSRAAGYLGDFLDYTEDCEDDETIARQREKAEAVINGITKRNLDDELFREAYDFIRIGEPEKGLEKAKKFLEYHSSVWNGWFLLGWALRKLGRWQDGAAAFKQCADLGGDGADTRNELAICLMETGDLRGARREAEHALTFEPENIKVISNLAVIALREGNHAEAAGFFKIVLDLDPDDPVAKHYFEESR
ncbi:MAG: tetratricopeptide repeat protein [Spirochaetaceae bacterium]|jgi:tetratricopeptide (TPR) repeat protein|nr:tetratricopeptide repeat protein [Spirochaetaceae bacterium]